MRLGRFDEAAASLDELSKKHPGDVDLADTRADLLCAQEKWQECAGAAERALEMEKGRDPKLEKIEAVRARLRRAQALFHLARLDDADKELAEVDKVKPNDVAVENLKKTMVLARTTQLIVEPVIQPEIGLGIYHLYGVGESSMAGPVVRLDLYNLAPQARAVRIEVEVSGVTEKSVVTVPLLSGGKANDVRIVPPLRASYDVNALRGTVGADVHLKLVQVDQGVEKNLMEQSYPVTLLARDLAPTRRKIGGDYFKPTWEYLAAWVTPNAKGIDEFLAAAKKRMDHGMDGEKRETLPQVRALWDELQARGVSYVKDPSVFSEVGTMQRIRLPAEVLQTTNAQCVEATVLMASLMEAIGLRPVLISVPRHMFLAWHASKKDGSTGELFYVEMTMIHKSSLEKAMRHAEKRIAEEEDRGSFAHGTAIRVDVRELRKAGIAPQPW
jgi:hypothetical protein